jgi:hypothetical protein
MRKNLEEGTLVLNFTNVVIKGVLKAKVNDGVNSEGKIGWIRIEDIHVNSLKEIPLTIDMKEWEPFIKQYSDLPFQIEERFGLIIEIYENYEGYLYFSYDLTIGNVANEEYEDIYAGNHFD